MRADEQTRSPDDLADSDETEAAESARPERSSRRFRVDTADGAGKVVLVADDSPMIRLTVVEIVKKLGHQVIEATNGVEAIAAARSNCPDLIVLDVNMPEKTGIEVLTELREDEAFVAVPVLMLTVHSDRATFRDAMAGGAVDYVLKPVNQADLTARLRKYL